jgi:ABC-type lipoprotein release transport system permease subunit
MRYRKAERLPVRPQDAQDDLDAEIRVHLEMPADALIAQGFPRRRPTRRRCAFSLLAERRLLLGVLWTFAGLAVLLACLGVYALISFAADERRRELAIRAALGANQRGMLALMLRDAARVLAVGLVIGLGAAYGLTALLESLLLDVSADDPLTYGAAALLLGVVGLGAAMLPSWQAAKVDPLTALSR